MSRRLPPLNQLRAFEAAARHQSFRDAADELFVTHAAISHQIRALEETLGAQLFHRGPKGVQLTDTARVLAGTLTESLDEMDRAVGAFRSQEMIGTIRISVVPWYGSRFLLPKLDEFHAANPGLQLELDYSYQTVDFANSDFDAAMRHGLGDWPGLSSIRVHHDIVSPVCAPTLVEGRELPLSADQITTFKLGVARGHTVYWEDWLKHAGVTASVKPNYVQYENRALMLELATSAQGVSLSDLMAVQLEIDTGKLVRMHPQTLQLDTGMHLVFPETSQVDPRLQVVADWMKTCLRSDPVAA